MAVRSTIRFEYPVHEMVEPALERLGIDIRSCHIPVHHYGKLNEFNSAIKALSSAHKDISAFIEKGDIIENFDLQRVSDSTRQRDGQVNDLKNI